jgi:thiol-disulfide isomerase/thioredoxin
MSGATRTCALLLLLAAACARAPVAPAIPTAAATASARPAPVRPAVSKDLPLVAIVRADWCPACRKVEPTLAEIEKEYAGRITFVRLDVTDDDTTAGASDEATADGVGAFFGETKGRTATIGVFSRDRKELFRTWGLKNEAELRQALDAAAKP